MIDKITIQYVQPTGDLPDIVGTKQGAKLLVIGSAACVWDDLSRYDFHGHDLMAVNDMMMHFPDKLDYGATCHPEKLPAWSFFKKMEIHSHIPNDLVTWYWPLHRQGGTSGLFAITVGLLMGYDRIVLAGVPCDDSPRFFEPPWKTHAQFGRDSVMDEWRDAAKNIFNDKVKSLSGKTRELLGEP
jgi:hypothetical protein